MKLARVAARLKRQGRWRNSVLPSLWYLTDETRPDDPWQIACTLPNGTGIVLRHYRDPRRAERAHALAAVARERGLKLLIGADARLAQEVKAHGVHLPRWAVERRALFRYKGWLTTSAHSRRELAAALVLRPDAVFLAPVFATESHKGAQSLGAVRFSQLTRLIPIPAIALGGIGESGARLLESGAAGLAAIGAFHPPAEAS